MSAWLPQVALILGSVAVLLGVMHAVRLAGVRYGWPAEVQRKIVHVATGAYALTLPLVFSETWPVLLLVAVTVVVMSALRLTKLAGGVGAAIHGVERRSYGDFLFALSVGFLFFRSGGNPILFVLPIAVLTLSDTAAALAGSAYGRRVFTIEAGTKSIEGVVVFFLVTCIISMVLLLLMTDTPRLSVVVLAVLIAAFGALVEADSWRGFDNLFLPVGLHLFLQTYLSVPPHGLLLAAAGFVALVALILIVAPTHGLTAHSARAHAVALFLICCYTAPQNAILPALAVVAHVWAELRHPSRSPYPDLDGIATIIVVSLLWMLAGEWLGPTAINFYNMTFVGVTAVLLLLGFAGRARLEVVIAATATAAVLWVIYEQVVGLGPGTARWHGSLAIPLALTLLLTLTLSSLWPRAFERYRSPRVAVLAGVVPALAYLSRTLG